MASCFPMSQTRDTGKPILSTQFWAECLGIVHSDDPESPARPKPNDSTILSTRRSPSPKRRSIAAKPIGAHRGRAYAVNCDTARGFALGDGRSRAFPPGLNKARIILSRTPRTHAGAPQSSFEDLRVSFHATLLPYQPPHACATMQRARVEETVSALLTDKM